MISKKEVLNFQIIAVIIAIIFLIIPIVGIVLATINILYLNNRNKKSFCFLFLLLAIYISAINVTKDPASSVDQINYYNAYQAIPTQSFWESLINIYGSSYKEDYTTKEIGYGLLNYIGYYISFGSYKLFILYFSIIVYMLYFLSIYKFFYLIDVEEKSWHIVSAAYILTFFTQLFNLTLHLQRQEVAIAVMIYAIVVNLNKEKVNWILPILAMLLHTSVALFIPVFLIKLFSKEFDIRHTVIISAIIGCFLFILSYLPDFIASSLLSTNMYGLSRLARAGNSTEESFSLLFIYSFCVPLLFIVIKNILNGSNGKEKLFYIFFLTVFFMTVFTPDNTMRYRFFMMSYSFWPFIIPLLYKRKSYFSKFYLCIVATFFLFRFYITFEDIPFDYAPIEDVIADNIFSLLLINYW